MQKKRFFVNAALLSLTSVIMQTVGVSFNIYVSKKIGAEGTGLFSLIMSVYVFGVTLAASGINLAATRLISEELALKNKSAAAEAARYALLHGLFFGTLAFLTMFFGANFLGTVILADARTVKSFKILSLSLPFVGMSSALSGYFTAVRRVVKSASAQILEQAVKIAAVVLFLKFYAKGNTASACAAIVGGGCVAEISSFAFIYILYRFDIKKYKIYKKTASPFALKRLLIVSLPVAFSAYIRSSLRTAEHILIPKGLKKHGASPALSLALYGVIHGMAMPVLLFPSSFLTAFSNLLVPEITECQRLGKNNQIRHIMTRVFSTTFIFAVGACGIFLAFSSELGMAIYSNADAAKYIKLTAPLVITMYIDTVTDAVLKGMGEQLYSMRINVIDSAISVLLTLALIPKYGINGYIAVIFTSELLNTFLSVFRLIYITDFKLNLTEWLIKPSLAIAAAIMPVKLFSEFHSDTPQKLTAEIVLCAVLYLLMVKITENPQNREKKKRKCK